VCVGEAAELVVGQATANGGTVIILGVILLIVGYLLPVPFVATIGWILVVLGVVLWLLNAAGHGVGGRHYW